MKRKIYNKTTMICVRVSPTEFMNIHEQSADWDGSHAPILCLHRREPYQISNGVVCRIMVFACDIPLAAPKKAGRCNLGQRASKACKSIRVVCSLEMSGLVSSGDIRIAEFITRFTSKPLSGFFYAAETRIWIARNSCAKVDFPVIQIPLFIFGILTWWQNNASVSSF